MQEELNFLVVVAVVLLAQEDVNCQTFQSFRAQEFKLLLNLNKILLENCLKLLHKKNTKY